MRTGGETGRECRLMSRVSLQPGKPLRCGLENVGSWIYGRFSPGEEAGGRDVNMLGESVSVLFVLLAFLFRFHI